MNSQWLNQKGKFSVHFKDHIEYFCSLHNLAFQVQEDLRQLRENIVKGDGKTISIEELESALNKTEQGLQVG